MKLLKKIISVYKGMSTVSKASLWFMMCTMLQKCLALIMTPIFTRIMSGEQYGYYSTYLSVTTILTVLLTLNFDSCAYMNGVAKFKTEKEKDQLASSLLLLTITITLVFSSICIVFRKNIADILSLPEGLIIIMLAEILFIPPLKFWMVKQRFSYKYVSLVSVTLGMLLLNNLLGIVLVLNLPQIAAHMRVLSIALVQALFGLFLYVLFFKKSGSFPFTRYWKYGLKLNLPLVPHGLSLIVLSSSDRIMINSMIGAIQAGIYGVAYSAGQIINAIKLSLVDALRPWIYEKLKKQEFRDIKGICKFVFIANILMTFVIVGLAPEIICILAPTEYIEAIYIIPPVAASSYFTFIYNICSIVEIYYEKNKRVMVASVVAAVINIVLNYLCIPVYGYLAAGYTTLFSYIVLSVMHFSFLNQIRKEKMQGIHIIDLKSTALFSIVVLIVMVLFTLLYSHTIIRLIVVAVILIACFIMKKKFLNIYKSIKMIKKA